MPQAAAQPVYANIAFLRIPDFESRSVSEQAALKEKLEAYAKNALRSVASSERVVLDADDGLAIVLFSDPALALEFTEKIHAHEETKPLQAGLNYGPLALTTRGADGRVFGDGLTAAAAAARFASAGRLLVTQDFRKALAASSPERAATLAAAGEFTDSRVRLHSFYAPDPQRRNARRRALLAYGVAGVGLILLLGLAAREARVHLFPPLPATVKFMVKPRGEVIVDGISKGRAPPLAEIEIPAGRRVIEVRNPGFPPLEVTLDLEPGERRTLTHTFARREPPPKSDFWRDLKKKFGS